MSITKYQGITSSISIESVAGYLEIGDTATASKIIQAGGFLTILFTEEAIAACLASVDLNPVYKESIKELSPGYVIMATKEYIDVMTEDELHAMLAHEDAHGLHGDLDHVTIHNEGFLVNQEAELKADAYAASKTSKEVMLSALIKALTMTASLQANSMGCSGWDRLNHLYTDETIGTRLVALGH